MSELLRPRIVDLHQDLSAIVEETGVNLAQAEAPLGTTLPMYGDPEHLKTLSSDVDSLRNEVKIVVANMFPNPENDFAEEYAWHQQYYNNLVEGRKDALKPFASKEELETVLSDPTRTGALYSLEGIYHWDGDMHVLDTLWQNGVRSIMPVWNDDSEVGTGHKTPESYGLTQLGKTLVEKADQMGFFIDFSHASEATAKDALRIIKHRPPIISHTGSRTIAPDETRCTLDEIAIEVARRDGLIGIMPASWIVEADERRATVASVVNAMEHYMNIFEQAGISDAYKRIAVGTDFNGMGPKSTIPGIDTIELFVPALYAEMKRRGYDSARIEAIFASNAIEFLQKHLPNE